MKALYPKQEEAARFFVNAIRSGKNTIDTSSVGTGKTVVASYIAKDLICKAQPNPHFSHPFVDGVAPPRIFSGIFSGVAVICPKSVIPSWERELEEFGIEPLFVLNYEKIRTGNTDFMSKKGKKLMDWHIPKDTLVLVDEIHKCKGPYTQNAQLVISLVQQGYQVHGMSATSCEDPTEMRAIGYMLGLHNLNKSKDGKQSWYSWMLSNGCAQDLWKQWRLISRSKLTVVKECIYGDMGFRLTIKDFPDSFRANRVFVEPIQFADSKKIIKAYADLGITPAIVNDYIENGTVIESEHVLVNLLRARMLAESFKAPCVAEQAEDLVSQGNSVVLFVNFRESMDALCEKLKCERIDGGQSTKARQQVVDAFQADEIHVIAVNTAAGGVGLSLHDTHGDRQRISLISPSFSAKDHLQTLGRIHRNGAKSDAIQKILVTADSIEETVMKSINKKLKNLTALHG